MSLRCRGMSSRLLGLCLLLCALPVTAWLMPPVAQPLEYHRFADQSTCLGDLRPHLLMELVPILLVPLLLWLYPPRYTGDRHIVAAAAAAWVMVGLAWRRPLSNAP